MLPVYLQILFHPIIIGLLNVLEFLFFNKEIFYRHNFPDNIPTMNIDTKPRAMLAAFWFGIKCSWVLYISLAILYWILDLKFSEIYYEVNIITIYSCIVMMIINKITGNQSTDTNNTYHTIFVIKEIATLLIIFS